MLAARYSSRSSGSAPSVLLRSEFGVLGLEGVRDVLEEDQPEDDVLVLGGVHVVAQRVGRGPELGLEAEVCGVSFLTSSFMPRLSHGRVAVVYPSSTATVLRFLRRAVATLRFGELSLRFIAELRQELPRGDDPRAS